VIFTIDKAKYGDGSMDNNEKKNGIVEKKAWRKPTYITIHQEEIAKHIQASACSGGCIGGNAR